MRRSNIFQTGGAIIIAGLINVCGVSAAAGADTANIPSLTISQIKITSSNGQFITLYNASAQALDMAKYQLEYFNSYDLSKATSSRLISLSGTVPPHGYFMVNDGVYTLCYQLGVDSVSLGLSSTAGLVEVLGFDQAIPGGSVSPVLQDYVGWSKTVAVGAQTLPASSSAFLDRQPLDAAGNPAVATPGGGTWQTVQPDSSDACELVSGSNAAPVATGFGQLLPAVEPAATIISTAAAGTASPTAALPPGDVGLMAPQVTEILPNPTSVGTDATDEFIELYNPNSRSFDLSGFSLQAGTTTLHTYHFASGTVLSAHAFKAYYSSVSALSLSNSGGQVKLLDPFGNSVSATAIYTTAKDGQAWALANGKWYWTTKATPGAANIINQPPVAKKTNSSSKASKSKKTKAVKTAQTKKTATEYDDTAATTTPIHAATLVAVAVLALVYAVYEYRTDVANYLYKCRRYFQARRADRTQHARR